MSILFRAGSKQIGKGWFVRVTNTRGLSYQTNGLSNPESAVAEEAIDDDGIAYSLSHFCCIVALTCD